MTCSGRKRSDSSTATVRTANVDDGIRAGTGSGSGSGACSTGNMANCVDLGVTYESEAAADSSVEFAMNPKVKQAADLYRQACTGHQMKGCFRLGKLYATGAGVTVDIRGAIELFERACDGGEMEACNQVAGAGAAEHAASLYLRPAMVASCSAATMRLWHSAMAAGLRTIYAGLQCWHQRGLRCATAGRASLSPALAYPGRSAGRTPQGLLHQARWRHHDRR